jgi:hypothetical protein
VAYAMQQQSVQQVTLYQFERSLLTRDTSLSAGNALQLETETVDVSFNEGDITLNLRLRGGLLLVALDETPLLETALPIAPGQVGVQLPAGTDLNALRVEQVRP